MSDTKNWVPDWALDMARVPYNPMQDRAAFNFSTGGPCSALPEADRPKRPVDRPAPSSGWSDTPFVREDAPSKHPVAHVDAVDRLVAQTEAQERRRAPSADMEQMMAACTAVLQMQSQTIAALAALVLREDNKPKAKPKQR